MVMHPSLRILLLLLLAIAIQFMELYALAFSGTILLALAMYWHIGLLIKILLRSRWLLLTLLLVYAFTTPGEYLRGWDAYAPTYEGIKQGLLQAARLTMMLAALAILLGTTPRAEMMAGIYQLMRPLRVVGISVDRFTARLWLTMHYVELERPKGKASFWERFESASNHAEITSLDSVKFHLPGFTRLDWGVVSLIAILIVGCLV
jgi:energy-coupling factor transporter transmembrane protein EcfT